MNKGVERNLAEAMRGYQPEKDSGEDIPGPRVPRKKLVFERVVVTGKASR